MIPIITGVIASSYSKEEVVIYQFNGADSCSGASAIAFATSPILTVGVQLYADEELNSIYWGNPNASFSINGFIYFPNNDSSAIGAVYTCLTQHWTTAGGSGCGGSTSTGYFWWDGDIFNNVVTVYVVPYNDPNQKAISTSFGYDSSETGQPANYLVSTDNNGIVNSVTSCGT